MARSPSQRRARRGVGRGPAAVLLALSGLWAAGLAGAGGGAPEPAPSPVPQAPAAPAPADAECAREVVLRVQGHYEGVRDLRARFTQTTERASLGGFGAESLEARGEVWFAKPGRMRWSYEEPEPSLVIGDGETLWIYDPAAAEAQRLPLGPSFLSGAAIQFLLGRGRILEDFSVEALACGAERAHLRLVPRADAPYERLEVWADRATGSISETTVVDLLGNRTRVSFTSARTNTGPDPDLFRFVPPEGTRVIEVEPAP